MARTTLSNTSKFLALARTHWLMVVIVLVATWVRVWQLDTHAIFFGDAASDLLVAIESVAQRQLPLLGIPSSVPRFRQGPVTIWLEMMFVPLFGHQLLGYSLVFALLSLGALLALYEVVITQVSKKAAWLASALFAFSPLAIAHARMVYHITPLPLATVAFLWSLVRLWQKRPWALFWAAFAFGLMFQFELAVFPLIFMLPYIWWRTRRRVTITAVSEGVGGLALSLAPQIIYDLTHQFQQLGGFGVWVGYRLGSFVIGDHAPSLNKFTTFATSLATYGGRIGAVNFYLGLGFLALTAFAVGWLTRYARRHSLPPLIEVTLVSFYLLFIGYFIHGSPSEAYYPPFLILVPILLAFVLNQWSESLPSGRHLVAAGVSAWAVITLLSVIKANFFVSTPHSFNYGPSVGEQRTMVHLIKSHEIATFHLRTTEEGGAFDNYFDNFRFWCHSYELSESKTAETVYFVEPKNSALTTYPNFIKYSFASVDLYRVL